MAEQTHLGAKVRALRRARSMTQVALAERLGISPSYLNLIEHNRRSLSAPLLIRLAGILDLDLKSLSVEQQARETADLMELFGDPLFDGHDVTTAEVKDLAATCPSASRAVLALYRAYREAREAADTLSARISAGDLEGGGGAQLPTEEVSDFIQRQLNHFPELEAGAELLWEHLRQDGEDLGAALTRRLGGLGVQVRVGRASEMDGAMRRYDGRTGTLWLSELLRRGSRHFQLAHQLGLLTQAHVLDRFAADPHLTSDPARRLARVALASYFAGAVLMPYRPFLEAARAERYDIELLGHRFRVGFEQICHRLTTLRRPGAEGIPFHMVRVDVAGNISKRFSASGLRFARFSGACPRWTVFEAFMTPGLVRTQLSQMPDGATYFWMARTVRKEGGGFHARRSVQALGLGCEVRHARDLVYADGVDLSARGAVVPVGLTCRLCERMECEQRAFPPLQHPLKVDEDVRGISFYAPPPARER
jgi:predicted transcriptional regulator/transcriptional regulator with XRE-family HTH domain